MGYVSEGNFVTQFKISCNLVVSSWSAPIKQAIKINLFWFFAVSLYFIWDSNYGGYMVEVGKSGGSRPLLLPFTFCVFHVNL